MNEDPYTPPAAETPDKAPSQPPEPWYRLIPGFICLLIGSLQYYGYHHQHPITSFVQNWIIFAAFPLLATYIVCHFYQQYNKLPLTRSITRNIALITISILLALTLAPM